METKKISAMSLLAAADVAADDIVEIVDVSDTTDASTGTNKRMKLKELFGNWLFNGDYLIKTGDENNYLYITGLTVKLRAYDGSQNNSSIDCYSNGDIRIHSSKNGSVQRIIIDDSGIEFNDLTIALINAATGKSAITKEWVELKAGATPTIVNASTYTVLSTDGLLHVTYTATGACTITIPSALITTGFLLTIKDGGLNAGDNPITVMTEGSETIDGETDYIMNTNNQSITLYSDGTNLFIK